LCPTDLYNTLFVPSTQVQLVVSLAQINYFVITKEHSAGFVKVWVCGPWGGRGCSFFLSAKVDCVWNVMAHAQKPDFVFRRNGRVHVNRQGCQFSRLLAAEVCASAVVMLDTPSSEVVEGTGYPLHSPVSPSLPLPCVTVSHQVSTGLYY